MVKNFYTKMMALLLSASMLLTAAPGATLAASGSLKAAESGTLVSADPLAGDEDVTTITKGKGISLTLPSEEVSRAFAFTPQEDGNYILQCGFNGQQIAILDISLFDSLAFEEYYDDADDLSWSEENGCYEMHFYDLSAGHTYGIDFFTSPEEGDPASCVLSIDTYQGEKPEDDPENPGEELQVVASGQDTAVVIPKNDGYRTYSFTPTAGGDYVLRLNTGGERLSEIDAGFYTSTAFEEDYDDKSVLFWSEKEGLYKLYARELEAGHTYGVDLYTNNGAGKSLNAVLRLAPMGQGEVEEEPPAELGDKDGVKTILPGENTDILIPSDEKICRFKFTAEEAGDYVLSCDVGGSELDVLDIYLFESPDFMEYHEDADELAWSSKDKLYKMMLYGLEAGHTYGLDFYSYNDSVKVRNSVLSVKPYVKPRVTVNGNGGLTKDGRESYEYEIDALKRNRLDEVLSAAGSFSRTGYALVGWSQDPGASSGSSAAQTALEDGMTLYAVWCKMLTVTFHGNGANFTASGSETLTKSDVLEGRRVSAYNSVGQGLKAPLGNKFSGWALTADAAAPEGNQIVADGLDLYAVWEIIRYNVKLNAGSGYFETPGNTVFSTSAAYGQTLESLPSADPVSTVRGMTFAGWFYDAECTKPLDGSLSEYVVTENAELYAGYKDDGTLAKSVKLNRRSGSLYVGNTLTLKATVSPDTTLDKGVTWKSSNTAVAKVDSNGVVTAVRSGTCKITAASSSSGVTASCTVKVKQIYIYELSKEGRLYRYTTDTKLVKKAKNKGWSARKAALAAGNSSCQVYQIYDSKYKAYQYTTSRSYALNMKRKGKKVSEAFFASEATSTPVYELRKKITHPPRSYHYTYRYTTSRKTARSLKKKGWEYKRVAFYSELSPVK